MGLPAHLSTLAVVIVSALAPCAAADPREAAVLVREGEALLRAAALGRDDAATRALAAFDAVLEADPAHAHARAGRGLALVAQALTAPLSRKLALATEGCAELDAAVAAAPADPAIRLMRATNAMLMPVALERQAVAESDFIQLLAWARDTNVTMAPETRRGVFFQAAAFALKERRTGAVELLEEALTIPAAEPTDEQIQSMLALARRQAKTSPSHADSPPPEKTPASRP